MRLDGRSWIHLCAALVVAAVAFAAAAVAVEPTRIHADANQYLVGAYHLHEHGTFSLEPDPDREVTPSAFRTPLYPLLLAGVFELNDALADVTLRECRRARKRAEPVFVPLLVAQRALSVAAAFLAFLAGWMLTRRPWVGWLSMAGVLLSPMLTPWSDRALWSEPLAAVVLLCASAALWWAYRRDRAGWYLLPGALFGLLTLTKAAYLFFLPIAALLVLLRPRRPWRHRGRCAAALVVAYAALVAPWVGRNAHHFDRPMVSLRGGQALAERASLDRMTTTEMQAAFCVYAGSCLGPSTVQAHVGEPARKRLQWWKSRESYFDMAKRRQRELRRELDARKGPAEVTVEARQRQWALERILERPGKHLLVSVPLAHRALFVEGECWSPLLWIAVLLFFLLARRSRLWSAPSPGVFLLPLAFHFAFHTLLTKNVTRFYTSVVPELWIGVAAFLALVLIHLGDTEPLRRLRYALRLR